MDRSPLARIRYKSSDASAREPCRAGTSWLSPTATTEWRKGDGGHIQEAPCDKDQGGGARVVMSLLEIWGVDE